MHSHDAQLQASPSQHWHPASHAQAVSHGQAEQAAAVDVVVVAASFVMSQPHFSHLQTSHEQVTPSQSGHAQLTHSHFFAAEAVSAAAQENIPSENVKSAAKTSKLFMVKISKRNR
ncbi:hypothetical protein LOC68_13015 [Blastopirellula sp. JC732]|uniref:Uncharacterized protein n=1 Tax=Blastopirellula sediminis TaxID=2894196 RepID=A0A9X1MLE6_9BACT|nr:hypothetical protein [Blastopirellula sediminis]MCC9607389.1 hypothetical protein [Blastopirellula sediminis]MCC9629318.1 hypothetical protein [Blastopirellula sediminis]